MKRRALNILASGSACLSILVAVLWVRSYWMADHLQRFHPTDVSFTSTGGRLCVHVMHWGTAWGSFDFLWVPRWRYAQQEPYKGPASTRDRGVTDSYAMFGFGFERYVAAKRLGTIPGRIGPGWSIKVPHALIVFVMLCLPAWRISSAYRGRRRHRDGLCQQCGYDLRESKSRCPECGTLVVIEGVDLAHPA